MKKLTIGIPVLECCDTIKDCLLPLLRSGDTDFFTIIILVNDASDGTMESLTSIGEIHETVDIKIVNDGPAKGIEYAIWKLMELSETEWVWLLSGDDIPVKDWSGLVLDFLTTNHDLAIFQTIQADELGHPLFYRNNLKFMSETTEYSYIFPKEKKAFLAKIKSTDAIFSCISNVIFKKSIWHEAVEDEYIPFKGTNFMHSMRLLASLNRSTHMKVSGVPIVFKRGGDDSFSKSGLINRAMMTYNSYGQSLRGFSNYELKFIKSSADYEWPWYKCVKVDNQPGERQLKDKFLHLRFGSLAFVIFRMSSMLLKYTINYSIVIKLKRFLVRKY